MARKPTSKAAKHAKANKVMSEYKAGTLRSSSGNKVTSHKQAAAIARSESGQAKKKRS